MIRSRTRLLWSISLVISLGLLVAGCGDDDAADPDGAQIVLFDATPPDASQPDAFVCTLTECGTECVDTDTDPLHCGACNNACQPAADCAAPDCICPGNFVPSGELAFIFEQMDTTMAAPDVVGLGAFSGTDGAFHAVLVLSNPDSVAIGEDIDLSTVVDSPQIGFGYQATMTSIRSGYFATTGTLHLTRSCDAGVAGTLTDADMVEVDFNTFVPIAGGCTLTGVSTSFDIGDPCVDPADAGVLDAGTPDATSL